MDENLKKQIQALLPALKSLQTSVERAQATGMIQGTGQMAARSYTVLHSKIATLLPDDPYITEALKLDNPADTPDESLISQVNLAASQLYTYLKNLGQDEDPWLRRDDWRELKNLGRELQDQIMTQTRTTLRRALSGLDVPPVPPTPPTPPTPPVPPRPRVVRIEIDDDEETGAEKPKNDDSGNII